MKNYLLPISLLVAFYACKKTEEPKQVNQYTIEQFYANTQFS